MSNQPTPSPRKKNLGFVELPDEALDLFSHYTQIPEWDVVLVVDRAGDSYAARMAEILQIPVLDVANRLALLSCNRVIVGDHSASLLASVQEMVEGTEVEVVSLDKALEDAGLERQKQVELEPSSAPLDTAPLDDGLWGPEPVFQEDAEVLSAGLEPQKPAGGTGPPQVEARGAQTEEAEPTETDQEEPPVPGDESAGIPAAAEHELVEVPSPVDEAPAPASDFLETDESGLGSGPNPERPEPAPAPPDSIPADRTQVPASSERSGLSMAAAEDGDAVERSGFDVGALLGVDMREKVGPILLGSHALDRLQEVLTLAVRATHTQAGSIMLLDADGRTLRVAASVGLPSRIATQARRKIGEGISGQVFATKKPRIIRGPMPGGVERKARPLLREAVSVPILSDGNPFGVLNVNAETEENTLDDGTVTLLSRFAKEASIAILKALDLRRLTGDERMEAVLRVTDRLMGMQDTLPSRLHATADILGGLISADFVHFFVIDPLGRRLELRTPPRGISSWHPKSQPLDQGFLGWVVDEGKPQTLEVIDGNGVRRAAMICLPVVTSRPHGLIVFENVPLEDGSGETVRNLLAETLSHVKTLLALEEGIEADELLHQLKMRVLDYIPQVETLPPVQRTRNALDFAVYLLAGEAAIWVPGDGGRPVTSNPGSERSVSLLARVRADLDLLTEWVRERGAVAGGAEATGWDPRAPRGPAPYVGVTSADGEGVVLLFFSPEETVGSPAQVPAQVLLQVLADIAAFCSSKFEPGGRGTGGKGSMAIPRSGDIYGPDDLAQLIRHEYLRSRRYGHSFALTRFQLVESSFASDPEGKLQQFLVSNKRDVDLLARAREGTYVILSPEVGDVPDGIVKRLSGGWREIYPDVALDVEQTVFPRDGEAEERFRSWVNPERSSEEAA